MAKVNLELEPYNAMTILSFLREYVTNDSCKDYRLKALLESADELEAELAKMLTEEHWEEIQLTNQVNQLIGKSPKR